MSEHANPELGTTKKAIGVRGLRRAGINLDNFDAQVLAAMRLSDGTARDLTAVSMDEMRSLFSLAAIGGGAVQMVADLIAASDAGAGPAIIKTHLERLTDFVRPLMEERRGD